MRYKQHNNFLKSLMFQGRFLLWTHYIPKKTVEIAVKTDNHVLVQLKRNHPSLHNAMVKHSQQKKPSDRHQMYDRGRNRLETREASVWSLPSGTGTEEWHDSFKTLIAIHRKTDQFDTRKKDWKTSTETAYYLCDLSLSALQANTMVRSHWGIENRVHYIRDTRFHEDASRIRCNPSIFALLRSFAFNLLRFNKINNISLALYDNALSLDRVLAYKGL